MTIQTDIPLEPAEMAVLQRAHPYIRKMLSDQFRIENNVFPIIRRFLLGRGYVLQDIMRLLLSPAKHRDIVICRQFYFWYMYFHSDFNLTQVGMFCNKATHTTVMHSLRKYAEGLELKYPEYVHLERAINEQGLTYLMCIKNKRKLHSKYL